MRARAHVGGAGGRLVGARAREFFYFPFVLAPLRMNNKYESYKPKSAHAERADIKRRAHGRACMHTHAHVRLKYLTSSVN